MRSFGDKVVWLKGFVSLAECLVKCVFVELKLGRCVDWPRFS